MVAPSLSAGSYQIAALSLQCTGRFWLELELQEGTEAERLEQERCLGKHRLAFHCQEKVTALSLGCLSSHRKSRVSLQVENRPETSGRASGLLRSCENSPAEGAVAAEPFLRVVCRARSCLQGALAENIHPQQITSKEGARWPQWLSSRRICHEGSI